MDAQDQVMRAYARLRALRDTIAAMNDWQVKDTFASEYESALNHLAEQGFDVAEFRIPAGLVEPRLVMRDSLEDKNYYSDESYVERTILLMKVNGVLSYFKLLDDQKKGGSVLFEGKQGSF